MFAHAGAAWVKVGLAGIGDRACALKLLNAAARGAGPGRTIAVAYADYQHAGSLSPFDVLQIAASARLAGVLVDTADKGGPGLRTLIPAVALGEWIAAARHAGLLVAAAGRLAAEDIHSIRTAGADIVGVRGAACDGGRRGTVTIEKVRLLKGVVNVSRADSPERWLRPHP
jgi:uncharacterized protein (UPF0264 family)